MSSRVSRAKWLWSNVPLPYSHLAGIGVGTLLHRVRPWTLPGPPGARRICGWTLTALGTLTALRAFTAAREVYFASPDRIVSSGPYAICRNPMYAGWTVIQLGTSLAAGSGWILATVPMSVAHVHWEVLREERALTREFPDEFTRYRASVPRYLPSPRRLLAPLRRR